MKYLVVVSGGPGFSSPAEAVSALEEVVLPTFEEIARLQKEKKILAGGLPVGERTFVLIMEAASNDELDRTLRAIPGWGIFDWDVTALQDVETRAKMEREAIAAMKK